MKFSVLALTLVAVVSMGCQKKESSSSVISDSELAAYVGTWNACVSFTSADHGTDFSNSSSVLISITINADGTFSHSRIILNGHVAPCLGGTNPMSYTQVGTIDVVGNSTIAGKKDVSFTSSSTSVTVRNQGTFKADWNAMCFTAQLQAVGSDGVALDKTSMCNGNTGGKLFFGDLVGPTYTSYNAVSVSGTTLTMTVPFDWDLGVGGAPTSGTYQALNFTKQ